MDVAAGNTKDSGLRAWVEFGIQNKWEEKRVLYSLDHDINFISIEEPGATEVIIPEGVHNFLCRFTCIQRIDIPSTMNVAHIMDCPFLKEIELPVDITEACLDNHIDVVNLNEVIEKNPDADITFEQANSDTPSARKVYENMRKISR